MLYREIYRYFRKLRSDSTDDKDSNPVEPGKAREERQQRPDIDMSRFPAEGQQLETPEQLKAALQQMDAYEFEFFVGDLWERMGWKTEVSTESADQGVDVIARKSLPYDQLTLIQAKRYGPNTTVGSPDIQQYASLKNQYDGVDKVVVVTTNEFTQQARELADRLNVKLINGDDLIALLDEHEAADLAAEYLDFLALAEETQEGEHTEAATYQEASSGEFGDSYHHEQYSDEQHHGQYSDANQPREHSVSQGTEPMGHHEPSYQTGTPSRKWQGVIGASVVGWILLIAGLEMIPDTIGGIAILILTGSLPVAIYLDTEIVIEYVDWPAYRWLYVVGGIIWFLSIVVGIVYLWQRRKALQELSSP